MSLYDYLAAGRIRDKDGSEFPFYALIMAAMKQADTFNLAKLQAAFPEVYIELKARYNAPGGRLAGDE